MNPTTERTLPSAGTAPVVPPTQVVAARPEPVPAPPRPSLVGRVLFETCRALVVAGALTLLFVTYQLWGTSLRTAQAQRGLDTELSARLDAAEAAGATVSRESVPSVAALPPEVVPSTGEAAGRIEIPAIGVDWTFVEGVSVDDLKKGPGHYPETPWPGQPGNASLAGHRTTYGQPFHDVDRLGPDDEIIVTTVQGRFVYKVRDVVIVAPDEVDVLGPTRWDFDGDPATVDDTLTLTACHPKFSASQRIVVAAELAGPPAPPTAGAGDVAPGATAEQGAALDLDADLSGSRASAWPAAGWAAVGVTIWALAWIVARRHPAARWQAYGVVVAPFLLALFCFFEDFSVLLPANF
jgi:sortase A